MTIHDIELTRGLEEALQDSRTAPERLADSHRKLATSHRQSIANAKRALKSRLAEIKEGERLEAARHETQMAFFKEQAEQARASTAGLIAEDERLLAYNTGAIELMGE